MAFFTLYVVLWLHLPSKWMSSISFLVHLAVAFWHIQHWMVVDYSNLQIYSSMPLFFYNVVEIETYFVLEYPLCNSLSSNYYLRVLYQGGLKSFFCQSIKQTLASISNTLPHSTILGNYISPFETIVMYTKSHTTRIVGPTLHFPFDTSNNQDMPPSMTIIDWTQHV